MKRTSPLWALGLITLLAVASGSPSQERVAAPKSIDAIDVQTRGLVHDAMAQPFGVKPAPGPLVPKEPPALIREEPPEQTPDMENASWVPGYWAWDAQKQDFLWVSGVFRVSPQNRSYVPGYWANSQDGWRWVPGFWSSGKLQDNTYTPEPPATLDNGPALAAPDANSLYVPGTWVWQQDRFVWRPGYWADAQDGRVWVPPHYLWTPNGYVYVDGYWDYPLENRGVMFATIRFNQPLWNDPNWSYQPNYVVSPNNFLDSAFVNNNGFYYGNYYNPRDARAGFNPWYNGRGRYDPLFAYNGWKNPGWLAGVQQTYAGRSAGQLAAPPLTFGSVSAAAFLTPLNRIGNNQLRLVNTTTAQQATQRNGIQQSRQLAVTRQQFEAGAAKSGRANSAGSVRLAGSHATSGPLIVNGTGASHSDTALPKIINEARSVAPSPALKIVNAAPSSGFRGTLSGPSAPAPVRAAAPVRTVNATPARPVSAPRPAAGHKR